MNDASPPETTAEQRRAEFWLKCRDEKIAAMFESHNLTENEFLEWLAERLAQRALS